MQRVARVRQRQLIVADAGYRVTGEESRRKGATGLLSRESGYGPRKGEERRGQWAVFPGCDQCYELHSVLSHHWLGDWKRIRPVKTCHSSPKILGTSGGRNPRGTG